ncbi:transcriptional repressor [Deltaproteobacteria bacterium]|nr:transcriptional repressor [Deltaproteobacteria bacterium]
MNAHAKHRNEARNIEAETRGMYKQFVNYIAANGLKLTPQRRLIVDVFLRIDGHISTEELYDKAREVDASIGQATVYRSLKLLCESGLAKEVYFGEGLARYENTCAGHHHDHLICIACGKQVEFMDEEIENLQEKLAEKKGFLLTSHHMYLYGVCPSCRKK